MKPFSRIFQKKYKRGFSFIELIVVIAIIGILATLSMVGLNSIRVKTRDIKRNNDVNLLQSTLELYFNKNDFYPPTNDLLSGLPLVGNGKTYLTAVPNAPGNPDGSCVADTYTYQQDTNGSSYHLTYCLGDKGICVAVPGDRCINCTPSCAGKCTGAADGCNGTCSNNCSVGYTCQSGICITEPGNSWTKTAREGSNYFATVKSNFDGTLLMAQNVLYSVGKYLTYYYVSSDSGATWSKITSGPLLQWSNNSRYDANAMDYSGQKIVVGSSVGQRGAWLSTDFGANWTKLNPTGTGTELNWYAAAVDNDASVIAIASSQTSNQSRFFLSTNGGSSFAEPQISINNRAWRSIAIDDDGSFIIASSITNGTGYDANSRIFTSANGGTNWTERIPGGSAVTGWTNVDCDSDGSNLIASYGGKLWTSSDGGVNWTERQPAGVSFSAYTVSSNNSGSVLMAGAKSGRLYISTDYGVSWTEKYPPGGTPYDKPWWATAQDYDGTNLAAYGDYLYISP